MIHSCTEILPPLPPIYNCPLPGVSDFELKKIFRKQNKINEGEREIERGKRKGPEGKGGGEGGRGRGRGRGEGKGEGKGGICNHCGNYDRDPIDPGFLFLVKNSLVVGELKLFLLSLGFT